MIAFQQSRRIDQIGSPHGFQNVRDRMLAVSSFAGIRRDLKLRLLPALHDHRRHPVQTVQSRLDFVGRHLPELGLRHVADVRLYPKMGKLANVMRFAAILAVEGKSGCTREIAAFTYCSVWNMSTFQSKNKSISADPRLVMERTSAIPARCSPLLQWAA